MTIALILLVCLTPFFDFYAINLYEGLRPSDLSGYAAGFLTATAACYAILHGLLRPRSARLSSLFVVGLIGCVSYYDITASLRNAGLPNSLQAAGWACVLAVLLIPAWKLGARRGFRIFLLVYAIANLARPITEIARAELPPAGPSLPAAEAYPLAGNDVWSGEAIRTPNVYWIVPDSYPNEVQLRDAYDFDNTSFLRGLESRGFFVERGAYANYSDTNLSVPATLNMRYDFAPGELYAEPRGRAWALLPGRTNSGIINAVAGDNRTVAYFHQLGYEVVHWESSFNLTRCRGYEDHCLRSPEAGLSELELNLLALVPYKALLQATGTLLSGAVAEKGKPASGTGVPELAAALASFSTTRPFFLYAHLPSPHPPFLADENCEFGPLPLTPRSFARQLACVNRHLDHLLDQLVREDPSAIIVLSGDHGPRMTVPAATPIYELDSRQIRESLGVLNALRLPESCRSDLPPTLSPVNDMRVVFACLGGHSPRLIEAVHFIVRGGWPDGGKIRRVSLR